MLAEEDWVVDPRNKHQVAAARVRPLRTLPGCENFWAKSYGDGDNVKPFGRDKPVKMDRGAGEALQEKMSAVTDLRVPETRWNPRNDVGAGLVAGSGP